MEFKVIYFDNSATTRTRPEVADLVAKYSVENFYNPSALYNPAIKVKLDVDNARKTFLNLLNADKSDRIIFTGSATEANNLILNGLARKDKKILVSLGEHPSIYEVARNLQNQGYKVDYVALNKDGTLNLNDLQQKLTDDVGLVSFIHVNNETGAINNISAISKLVKGKLPKCLVHFDGVQAFGKVLLHLKQDNIDAYTISSHKIHGPKGVACLYLKNGINIKPHILGGGQESGTRSGTENPAGIIGFTKAAELMYTDFDKKRQHIANLKAYLLEKLKSSNFNFVTNSNENSLANICSVSFSGVRGEVLLHCLEKYEIYVSTGSACSSKKVGNRVLSAMGQPNDVMLGNIRISFSEFNTTQEIDALIQALINEIPKIKN